jgi:8-oxo-dGTP pyrophosphatase MutT (NUDIX family)
LTHKQQDRFLQKIASSKLVRVSARSLCFRDGFLLVQQPSDEPAANFAFVGGQLELGQSLAEGLIAEYEQELGLQIPEPKYLFVVENRFWFRESIFHAARSSIHVGLYIFMARSV